MAERRMFAKTIIDSDDFLEMPLSAQALYFHLGMRADDDGFLNNARKILCIIRASDDDLKILIAKRFLIVFDGGIVVIKHWLMHNLIRGDRYKETVYTEEKAMLVLKENKAYTLPECNGLPLGNQMTPRLTQVRLGKDSIGEDSIEKERRTFTSVLDNANKDGCSRIEIARNAWNESKAGPPCKLMAITFSPQDREDCLRIMTAYNDDNISEAIGNYAKIRASPEHEISAPYRSFVGFMRGGVEKFVSDADPWTQFKKAQPPDWIAKHQSTKKCGSLDDRPDATTPERIRKDNEKTAEEVVDIDFREAMKGTKLENIL